MTEFYPRLPGGELASMFRLAFGTGMAASIVLEFNAIRVARRHQPQGMDGTRIRLALGAGTQVFTQGIGNAIFGISELNTALMLGAGWGINLAIVEYVIHARTPARQQPRRPRSRPKAEAAAPADHPEPSVSQRR